MTKKQKKMLIRIFIASAMLVLLNVLELPYAVSTPLYFATYLLIGYDILRKAWKGIMNRRPFDECFLMAVATLGAIALAVYDQSGDYNEAVAVMLFYQIGEFFQAYAVGKSRRNLRDARPCRLCALGYRICHGFGITRTAPKNYCYCFHAETFRSVLSNCYRKI